MSLREDVVLDTLGLANQYGFQELETSISDHLRQILALRNVCAILDTARLFGLTQLVKVCYTFMDRHALEILRHESLLTISQVHNLLYTYNLTNYVGVICYVLCRQH